MPPTPLTPTLRYYPPGTRKVYWIATASNYLAPTRSELNAGTDLTAEIHSMNGFSSSSATEDVPDLANRFAAKIPGAITADDSSIVFYTSSNSNDARTLLPRDTAGYVVILWEGDVVGQKMDVFPCKVSSVSPDTSIDAPGTVEIAFVVTRIPAQAVTIT